MMKWSEINKIREDEPFFKTVHSGDFEKIKEMVEKGANVNAINTASCTVLMLAGNIGRLDIMEYLYQKGASIETKTIDNDLAVRVPIRKGYIDIIQFYINHGVNLNAISGTNETALHLVVHAHRDGVAPDFTPEKKRKMLELLVTQDAVKSSLNLENNDGLTPLMIAIGQNDIDTFKWLIEAGADTSFKNKKGQDALSIAKIYFGRQDMIDILQNKLIDMLQNKLSDKPDSSYEFLVSKLLEKMKPIIVDEVKKQVAQEMKSAASKKEILQGKRASYFIESLSETTQDNSINSRERELKLI